jgi:hypothetical protein
MKLVVERSSQRVVGAHMIGADAGEIIQGVAIAVKLGATKAQFDATIGIHPTGAEEFVTMREELPSRERLLRRRHHATPSIRLSSSAGLLQFGQYKRTYVDACIVGAGISGLTTASPCARREAGGGAGRQPGRGGTTQMTTARITNQLDDRYFEPKRRGREAARLAAGNHTAAIGHTRPS